MNPLEAQLLMMAESFAESLAQHLAQAVLAKLQSKLGLMPVPVAVQTPQSVE